MGAYYREKEGEVSKKHLGRDEKKKRKKLYIIRSLGEQRNGLFCLREWESSEEV